MSASKARQKRRALWIPSNSHAVTKFVSGTSHQPLCVPLTRNRVSPGRASRIPIATSQTSREADQIRSYALGHELEIVPWAPVFALYESHLASLASQSFFAWAEPDESSSETAAS